MTFFEFIFIFSLTVILPLSVLKMTIDYKRQKLAAERPSGETGAGLTVGELKRLLREVVEEANAPLVERIAEIERQLPAEGSERLLDPDPRYESDPLPEIEEDRTIGRAVAPERIR